MAERRRRERKEGFWSSVFELIGEFLEALFSKAD
jgi:hypothetical protein